MSLFQRLASAGARLCSSVFRSREADSDEPELDAAEEFRKIQRGLRRLSLSSARGAEMLEAVTARLDEVKQALYEVNRPRQTAVALEEIELLHILDQLDRAVDVPDLPPAARSWLEAAKSGLLAGARWEAVAVRGGAPDGADIRIAEFLGHASANGQADARIHRVLEQGYRRADGTLLRPGVVIAAGADETNPAHERNDAFIEDHAT